MTVVLPETIDIDLGSGAVAQFAVIPGPPPYCSMAWLKIHGVRIAVPDAQRAEFNKEATARLINEVIPSLTPPNPWHVVATDPPAIDTKVVIAWDEEGGWNRAVAYLYPTPDSEIAPMTWIADGDAFSGEDAPEFWMPIPELS